MKQSECTVAGSRPALALYFILFASTAVATSLHALAYFPPVDLRLSPIWLPSSAVAALILGFLCGLTAMWSYRLDARRFCFSNLLVLGSVAMSLICIEGAARLSAPPWPASHLHGVDAQIGANAWGRVRSLHSLATENNSWGQRDLERTRHKAKGIHRIAFVGDSFLEESSLTPLSLLVEKQLPDGFEAINLGISAAFPIDYYYLIKNVALPLEADEVLTFIYMGNDFYPYPDERSALSRAFYSPAPHSSLLGAVLPGVNYWLTQRFKFTTNAWLDNDLHQSEQARLLELQQLDADQFVEALVGYAPGEYKDRCRRELGAADLSAFRSHLSSPDLGLFRTHTFYPAVCTVYRDHGEISPEEQAHVVETFEIIRAIQDLCDEAGVAHSVVLIPQGPEVDGRVQEHWAGVADLGRKYEFIHTMADQLRVLLEAYAVDTIDLYTVLNRGYGDYLNFDGHWSPQGNERVAGYLAQTLNSRLARSRAVSAAATR